MKSFLALLTFVLALLIASTSATTYNVTPASGNANILNIVAGLKAGDILNLGAGIYVNLNLDLSNLAGTADAWITIQGNNATLKCGGNVAPIVIGACANIKILGLTITTTGAKTIAGVQFKTGALNITLSGLVLFNINGNGIDLANVNSLANIVISNCDISACGKVSSTGGVAIVVGGLAVAVSDVANILITNNVVHDLTSVGAAIQVCLGVVAPQVTQNTVYNCHNGISVVTGICNNVLALLPRVIGNTCSQIGLGVGITIGAGSQCANNILASVNIGINLVLGGSLTVLANTTIAHNSVYQVNTCALQALVGLPDATLVIANNALAVGTAAAGKVLNVAGNILDSTISTILNNVVSGNLGVNVSHGKRALLNTAFLQTPIEELFGGLSTVVDDLQLLPLDATVNEVLNTVEGVVDQVGALVQNVLPDVQQIVDDLIPNLKSLLNALGLGGLLDPVLTAVDGLVDNLVPDLDQTVGDLVNSLNALIPTLESDLAPLLTTTLNEVEDVLGQILNTLGGTLGNVLGALGKRDVQLTGDLSSLAVTLKKVLGLVTGSVGGDVGNLLAGVDNTVNNLVAGLVDGSVVNVQLDINLAGLAGLVQAVDDLVNEVLTSVDTLLWQILGGVDVDLELRLGRLTIGARQAGRAADTYPTLGSYKLKLKAQVDRRAVSRPAIRS